MIISLYSDGKGGVGKSVIAQMLTLLLSRFLGEDNVALIDLARDSSVTSRLLKNPEPPFVSDWLLGRCELADVLRSYRLNVGDKVYKFWFAPNNSRNVTIEDLDSKIEELTLISEYLKATVLDLPTFPYDSQFAKFLEASDRIILVSTPDWGSLKAIVNLKPDNKFVIPVLNQYHPVLEQYKLYMEKRFGHCITLPHDKVLLNIKPERTGYILKSLSKDFQVGLGRLTSVVVSKSFAILEKQ